MNLSSKHLTLKKEAVSRNPTRSELSFPSHFKCCSIQVNSNSKKSLINKIKYSTPPPKYSRCMSSRCRINVHVPHCCIHIVHSSRWRGLVRPSSTRWRRRKAIARRTRSSSLTRRSWHTLSRRIKVSGLHGLHVWWRCSSSSSRRRRELTPAAVKLLAWIVSRVSAHGSSGSFKSQKGGEAMLVGFFWKGITLGATKWSR